MALFLSPFRGRPVSLVLALLLGAACMAGCRIEPPAVSTDLVYQDPPRLEIANRDIRIRSVADGWALSAGQPVTGLEGSATPVPTAALRHPAAREWCYDLEPRSSLGITNVFASREFPAVLVVGTLQASGAAEANLHGTYVVAVDGHNVDDDRDAFFRLVNQDGHHVLHIIPRDGYHTRAGAPPVEAVARRYTVRRRVIVEVDGQAAPLYGVMQLNPVARAADDEARNTWRIEIPRAAIVEARRDGLAIVHDTHDVTYQAVYPENSRDEDEDDRAGATREWTDTFASWILWLSPTPFARSERGNQ